MQPGSLTAEAACEWSNPLAAACGESAFEAFNRHSSTVDSPRHWRGVLPKWVPLHNTSNGGKVYQMKCKKYGRKLSRVSKGI
jgi:hypothetical protein